MAIKLKNIIKWLLVILFLLFLLKSGLEEGGICISKMTPLSKIYTEQQLIDKAILHVISNMPDGVTELNGERIDIRRYSGIEEFKKLNPNCCELAATADEGYSDSDVYGYVRVSYLRNYLQNIPSEEKFTYIEYNTCGEMKEFTLKSNRLF